MEMQLTTKREALSSQVVAYKGKVHEMEAKLYAVGNREKEMAQTATRQIALVKEEFANKIKALESENKDLVVRLQSQTDLAEQCEVQLNDVKSRLSVAELRLMNEVSSRDLQVRALEDRVRSKTSEFEAFQKATLEQKRSAGKSKDETKHLQSELEKTREDVKRYKEFEKMGILERQSLQSRLIESEKDVSKLSLEMER
jgi:chromosome segregation ATPase